MVGGNHADGAGGFSGGAGESSGNNFGKNGFAGVNTVSYPASNGSGYYSELVNDTCMVKYGIGKIGGQGGYYGSSWLFNVSGDGGLAGSGGKIGYSSLSKIYAFNGNMAVEQQSEEFFKYNCELNGDSQTSSTVKTNNVLKKYSRKDDREIIPTIIFAQLGVIRETYATNTSIYELKKIKNGQVPNLCTNTGDVKNVIATYAEKTNVTGYTNQETLDLPNQGIGSGARIFRSI